MARSHPQAIHGWLRWSLLALASSPRITTAAVFTLVWLACTPEAAADLRPGGGQSYSGGGGGGGGGSFSSGGSSGGGGDGLAFLLWLCIEHPVIGIPLTVALGVYVVMSKNKKDSSAWDSADTYNEDDVFIPAPAMTSTKITSLRKLDPDFSQVLFEDFVYRLYAAAHQARSDETQLAGLAPYLSPRARKYLKKRSPVGAPVSNVVIGSMKIIEVQVPDAKVGQDGTPNGVRVVIKFESNLTAGPSNDLHTYYLRERWVFIRDATVQTQAPDGVHSLHCPSCGAPYVSSDQNRCDHCHQSVEGGHFDWSVSAVSMLEQQKRPPVLTQTVIESGTNKATVHQPGYERRFAKLTASDPAVTADALKARLELIYAQLNQAWTALDLRGARPFVSDGLYNYLQYWIDAYNNQGLKNVLENMHITRSEIVKTIRDRHYDAVTIRVYATGLDYTIRTSDNKRMSGSAKRNRDYTEYWTLIRGAQTRGAPRTDHNCPNCGAPLKIEMAGACAYCNAHLTSGEFDWILSRIEQDDSYNG